MAALASVEHLDAAGLHAGLDDAFAHIAGRFKRREVRLRARRCLTGLLSGLQRTTGWSLAEHALPHEYPPWRSVYGYFAHWQNDGVFTRLNGLLRHLASTAEGRDPNPTACVIDAQSVNTSANVPAAGQGYDAGKKIAGRKRSIVTDTLGLLLAVMVTAAGVSDGAAGLPLLTQAAADNPTITKAWADSTYRTKVIEGGAALGIDVEVIRRDPATRGFTALPRIHPNLERRLKH